MAGNTFGKLFTVTTAGESHGAALCCIIDGCPPGLPLDVDDIQPDLDRRKPGTSRFATQRREEDRVEILSGIFEGVTTGTPIALLIRNDDAKSRDYEALRDKFRPGHADYTYQQKYGTRDHRGGGRSSARETAMRVAAGAIAKKWLAGQGIQVRGYLAAMGELAVPEMDWNAVNWQAVGSNPFFCPDPDLAERMAATIDALRRAGDSIGARVRVLARGLPPGLGEPVFDRLDADIAHAMMGINAVKAVALGAGWQSASQRGSEHRDEITPEGFLSNHAGGVLGGISTGQDLVVDLALKPTSSITLPGRTVDANGQATEVVTKGRHDPCVGVRATPIAEAMLALVLTDHLLRQRAQNADRKTSTPIVPAAAGE